MLKNHRYLEKLTSAYRFSRIEAKKLFGIEPNIKRRFEVVLNHYGTEDCGWKIPDSHLNSSTVVVDAGLGEDISFSVDLYNNFKCNIYGFDPTPKVASYLQTIDPVLEYFPFGIAVTPGVRKFYLPKNEQHVSGSEVKEDHLANDSIEVKFISLKEIFSLLNTSQIDILKLDIEGTEFDLLDSEEFREYGKKINMICIEFHHRWKSFGAARTYKCVERLSALGFSCVWVNRLTNEEFTFMRDDLIESEVFKTAVKL